jgi:DNA-binding MarR family transcriptional regulator
MKLEEALKTANFRNERHKVLLNIIYTAYWLKSTNSALLKNIGLTVEQFNVMRILKGKHPQPVCIRDIASRMIEKNSNVPRIIDRLVTKGIVVRQTSETDKRETLVSLTEDGMRQLLEANKLTDPVSDSLIGITTEEAVLLNELLEKLRGSSHHL